MLTYINSSACVDADLELYVAEIYEAFKECRDSQIELGKLWELDASCVSVFARKIRNEDGANDQVLRSALRGNCVVKLNMIIQDSQSKNLSKIPRKFKSSPLSRVITELYKPLLNAYVKANKSELDRLTVNRNNLYAHISAKKPTNAVLGHSRKTLSWLLRFLSGDEIELSNSAPYTVLENGDVLGKSSIFSDSSLDYLGALISLIRFAQEPEIKISMESNIERHLKQFETAHPLP